MKLIDTTVAVDHLRGLPAAVELLSGLVASGDEVVASELVRFELLAGVRETELTVLEEFCSALAWMGVTESVVQVAGQFARRFRRSHGGIDDVDYLIAATAIVLEADLLTTNVRHFPMFGELRPPY